MQNQRYLVRIARLRVLFLVSDLVDHSRDYRKRRSVDGLVQLVDESGADVGPAQNVEIAVLLPDFVPT
jgi:hypothetical protein